MFPFGDVRPHYSILSKSTINSFRVGEQPKLVDLTAALKQPAPETINGTPINSVSEVNFDTTATEPSTPNKDKRTYTDGSKFFTKNCKFDESFIKKFNFFTIAAQKRFTVFTKNDHMFMDFLSRGVKNYSIRSKNSPLTMYFADEYKILFNKNTGFKFRLKDKNNLLEFSQTKGYNYDVFPEAHVIKKYLHYLQLVQNNFTDDYLPAGKKTVYKIIKNFNLLLNAQLKKNKNFDKAQLLAFLLQNKLSFNSILLLDHYPLCPEKLTSISKNFVLVPKQKELAELFSNTLKHHFLMNKARAYIKTLKPWVNKYAYYVKPTELLVDKVTNPSTTLAESITIDKLTINKLIAEQTKQIFKNNLPHQTLGKTLIPENELTEHQIKQPQNGTSSKSTPEKTKLEQPLNTDCGTDSNRPSSECYNSSAQPHADSDTCGSFGCRTLETPKELPEWVFGKSTSTDEAVQPEELKGFVLERDQFGNPVPHEFPRRRTQRSTTNNLIIKPKLFNLQNRYLQIIDFTDVSALKLKKHKN